MLIKELLRAFQNESLLQGVERVTLLQKVIAGAIGYAAPCYVGNAGESGAYYRNGVLTPAVRIITDINEQFVINTDGVLADVATIWYGRYENLNYPKHSVKLETFHHSISAGATDLSDKYDYWVQVAIPAVQTYFSASQNVGA